MIHKDIHILLVDDEVAFANTLAQRLQLRGLKVGIAYDGEQALSKLKEGALDVIVLDLRMPGMDGMEVLREIKRGHPDVQVIILTGHGTERDAELAKTLGGFDFLNKPVEIDTLVQKIKSAFKEKIEKTMATIDHNSLNKEV
jgi:DNA-binding NtrC family response regulator